MDPSKIIEYPERSGAEDEDTIMPVMFKAAKNLKQPDPLAVLKAQAGLITIRMQSARTIFGKLESIQWVTANFDCEIILIMACWSMLSIKMVWLFVFATFALQDEDYIGFILSDKQTGTPSGIWHFKWLLQ